MLMLIVFRGYSGSGKTTALVSVARALTEAGMRVGTLKHVHDSDFTIDTKGKDTWLHAASGALTVVALAPRELAVIKKGDTKGMSLDEILRIYSQPRIDYLLVEGLHREFSRKRKVICILCARSLKEALRLSREHPRPICICGKVSMATAAKAIRGIPLIRFPEDIPRLLRMIGCRVHQ